MGQLQGVKGRWLAAQQEEWRWASSPFLDKSNSLRHLSYTNAPPPRKIQQARSLKEGRFKLAEGRDEQREKEKRAPPLDSGRRVIKEHGARLAKWSVGVAAGVKAHKGRNSTPTKQKQGGGRGWKEEDEEVRR